MQFSDVIGQQEMAQRLKTLVDEERLPHALMLCGPDGCGKMALAVALAAYILDRGAYKVNGIEHPDLHFTFPTIKLKKWNSDYKPVSDDFFQEWKALLCPAGGSDGSQVVPYFSLADWMEKMGGERQQAVITVGEANELIKRMTMKSNQGGYKVAIVWLPERMNLDCANKMLKLIEEPPSLTLFIFVCREPEKLLETIRSRVQRFDIKPIDYDSMYQALKERRGLSDEDAQRVARLAGGNWLAALDELNAGSENRLFFDYFVTLMRKAYMRDVKDLKRWSENVAGLGREEQKRLLTYLLRMTREAFMYNFQSLSSQPVLSQVEGLSTLRSSFAGLQGKNSQLSTLNYMTQEEEQFCTKFARFIHERNVLGFQDLFQRAVRDIGQNANAKMVFFDITMKVAVLLHTT